MKNTLKNILITIITISSLFCMTFFSISYASFAEFDDATADKQGEEDLKQQQAEDEKNAGKSSNNYLANLEVEGYTITPKFDKQTINYSIEEDITESVIIIKASPEDNRAEVTGTGKIELQSGENTLRINVKAENSIERTYFIKLNKKVQKEQPKLTQLKIKGVTENGEKEEVEISPVFSKDVFKYSCEVYNGITDLDIELITEGNAETEILGNENLKEGSNIVTIKVKDENEEETIYKIEVFRKESNKAVNAESGDAAKAVLPVFIIILIIIIISTFTKKNKKKGRKH